MRKDEPDQKVYLYTKRNKHIVVSILLDKTDKKYAETIERALLTIGEAEKLSVFELLSKLIPCCKLINLDSLLATVGDVVSRSDLEALVPNCLDAIGFDGWNPWPAVKAPVNTKLRAPLECRPHIRKCRDVLYLDKKPEKYTRIKFSEPGWYMIQTGEKIDNQKIKAWRIEKPYQE